MKKILLFLTALMTMLVFTGCDQDAGDSKSLESDWSIKGSFDGWADSIEDKTRHYFTMDELDNNILTYEITGLGALQTAFVIVHGSGNDAVEWKAPKNGYTLSETAVIFTDVADNQRDGIFIPQKDSYIVTVVLSDDANPSVTIKASSDVDAVLPSLQDHINAMKMKGDIFTPSWGEIDPTLVVDNVVTWDDVKITKATGAFMFNSLEGGLKDVAITAPTTGSPVVKGLFAGGDDITFANGLNLTDVYTFSIAIDLTAATVAEKYILTVTLKTEGSDGWPEINFAYLAEKIKMQGDLFVIGWNETAGTADATPKTVSWDVTINDVTSAFGFPSYDGYLKNVTVPTVAVGTTSTPQELTSDDTSDCLITGAVKGETYTITVTIDDSVAVDAGRYMMTVKRNS